MSRVIKKTIVVAIIICSSICCYGVGLLLYKGYKPIKRPNHDSSIDKSEKPINQQQIVPNGIKSETNNNNKDLNSAVPLIEHKYLDKTKN